MKARPDLVSPRSPRGLEVYQLSAGDVPTCHFYMEAQVTTPDSRFTVFHSGAHPHSRIPGDPRHRYYVCDTADGRLTPVVEEPDATGPAVSPDGQWLYYFVDETKPGGGRFLLRRVRLDGTARETLWVVDRPVEGARSCLSRMYPLSTISSDGRRIAISGFLGDGTVEYATWGLVVIDLGTGKAWCPLSGPAFCNIHPQYCRSTGAEACRDIMVQENHGCRYQPDGTITFGCDLYGCEIHVIRDDGNNVRSFPWGLGPEEACQGHQCWIGQGRWAITSTCSATAPSGELIAGLPMPDAAGKGCRMSGGVRTTLSACVPVARFSHFATDRTGRRLVTDGDYDAGGRLFIVELPEDPHKAPDKFRFLLDVKTQDRSEAHIHPFLSPDGRMAFFNSTESGVLQAYMARGF